MNPRPSSTVYGDGTVVTRGISGSFDASSINGLIAEREHGKRKRGPAANIGVSRFVRMRGQYRDRPQGDAYGVLVTELPHRVETSRLILRTWTDDDLDPLARVFAEEAVWRYPLGRALTRDETARFLRRQQQSWRQNGFGLWAAAMRDSGDLIGFVGLAIPEFLPEVLPAVEVGWRLHPRCWGQGLATEGGREALRCAFRSLPVDRVLSIAEPENEASIAVMRKLGMSIERTTIHPEHGSSLVVYQATRDRRTALAPQR